MAAAGAADPAAVAPGSPTAASSTADSMLVAPVAAGTQEHVDYKNFIVADFKKIGKQFGGPCQYLHSFSRDEMNDFAHYLWTTYPERDDLLYCHDARLPATSEEQLAESPPTLVHLTSCGFEEDCSLRPPTAQETAELLVDEIMADGFITSGQPLLVLQSHTPTRTYDKFEGELETFSLGYLKGMCRVSTVLTIIHRSWKCGYDLAVVHPTLHKTLFTIYVHHVPQNSKLDEALQNMKLSARGSIRKMVNVIQMVMMIKKLHTKFGLSDFGVFVRKWNGMAARTHQITGRRAMALKLLFQHSPEAGMCCLKLPLPWGPPGSPENRWVDLVAKFGSSPDNRWVDLWCGVVWFGYVRVREARPTCKLLG